MDSQEQPIIKRAASLSIGSASTTAPGKPRFFGQKIIKTRFQFKFAFSILIFLAISAAVVWFQGRLAVNNMIASGAVSDPTAIDQLKLLNSIVGRTIMLGLAITFGLALFFSHYLAGPLFRFERTLEEMRGGNLTGFVKLRKFDELQDVAQAFNQALAGMRSKVKLERDAAAAAMAKVQDISKALRQAGRTDEAAKLDAALAEFAAQPPHIRI